MLFRKSNKRKNTKCSAIVTTKSFLSTKGKDNRRQQKTTPYLTSGNFPFKPFDKCNLSRARQSFALALPSVCGHKMITKFLNEFKKECFAL
jgi:hypothetical protein